MTSEQEQRRRHLVGLVHEHFSGDCVLVAQVIEETLGDRVSERSVQAWLIEPGRKSSRNCPERVVKALESFVAEPGNAERLSRHREYRQSELRNLNKPRVWAQELHRSTGLELATRAVERDEKRLAELKDIAGQAIGTLLFGMERRLREQAEEQRKLLWALHDALKQPTYDECRATLEEHVQSHHVASHFMFEALAHVERGSDDAAVPA